MSGSVVPAPPAAVVEVSPPDPAFTTCHVPPKLEMPSPLASVGDASAANRYRGRPSAASTVAPSGPLTAVTFTPPTVVVAAALTVAGGQASRQAPVQAMALPPDVSVYRVRPSLSARIEPSFGSLLTVAV